MKALILLSGGLDSCVVLAYALSKRRLCTALSFSYGQRHICELTSAQRIASHYGVNHHVISIDPKLFCGSTSSLINTTISSEDTNTYVPCRNLLFLAHAACLAETLHVSEIYIGPNADDSPTYPDCGPNFISKLQRAVNVGSKNPPSIIAPLINLSKSEIVSLGTSLGAPIDLSWSCYSPNEGHPCGRCPACKLRNSVIPQQEVS